ncbi:MAG: SUF system NifU family Fe-S cluster assembly protein [Fimbriimonadaceae bacterium]|nr:SUF system NifU family Fe-S cluster assembly protein [Fimbriimonadaceae bacterium]
MMLDDLYQDVILDHNRRPRNFGAMEPSDGHAEGHNPLCGDCVTVFVKTDGERIVDVTFTGNGCAISTASASMMTEAVTGKTVAEALALFDEVQGAVRGDAEPDDESLGEIAALCGVKDYPMRVKCATLAWHTLKAALEGATVAESD